MVTRTRIARLRAGIAAIVLMIATVIAPLPAKAQTLTINEAGPYVAIDQALSVPTTEWRLNASATPQTNTNGTPVNFSLVFGFIDANNYYYANYGANAGVYKVTNGAPSLVGSYSAGVTAGQTYAPEIRHKDGAVRIYMGTTFLYKLSGASVAGTKLGVGTVNANATFANTNYVNGGTTALNLAYASGAPVPSGPTVQITAPASGAVVAGTQQVAANASDSQGVSSVQFTLDGSAIGTAVTSAPYTVSWDTTTVADGAHTLGATVTNLANQTAAAAPVSVTVNNQVAPPVSSFTVGGSNQNAGIDQALSTAGQAEWRQAAHVVPSSGSSSTPANFSFVFHYTDPQNYYYANFSSATKMGLSGVYRVTDGVAYKIINYTSFIAADQAVDLEIRYKDNTVRLYLNGTYLTKAEGITGGGTKVGVAAIDSVATFSNMSLRFGTSTQSLTPVATTIYATPDNPYVCLPVPSSPVRVQSSGRQVAVSSSAELKSAILDAQPGDTIALADGVYKDAMNVGNFTGSFAITASGQPANPITLVGSAAAVIDGDGPSGRYGLYLSGANYWNLVGFTVANASKGVVLDGSNHAFIEGVSVQNIGQEAVHFRAFSSDNVIKNSSISGTGRSSAQFGEGVYIGSASGANWGIYSGGLPDASDRNIVIGNSFSDFTAEGIDIKEGSSTNYVAGNTFDGSSISGLNSADSWVDVKGRCNLIENNVGTNSLQDGFQVHNVIDTWASYNMFKNNTANVNAAGYGFMFDYSSTSLSLGNIVSCTNVVNNAAAGFANVPCSTEY